MLLMEHEGFADRALRSFLSAFSIHPYRGIFHFEASSQENVQGLGRLKEATTDFRKLYLCHLQQILVILGKLYSFQNKVLRCI